MTRWWGVAKPLPAPPVGGNRTWASRPGVEKDIPLTSLKRGSVGAKSRFRLLPYFQPDHIITHAVGYTACGDSEHQLVLTGL